tara:strand:+ start:178 stop:441 length:264 start_codon:yes stop_codon:yes gene_type:complete
MKKILLFFKRLWDKIVSFFTRNRKVEPASDPEPKPDIKPKPELIPEVRLTLNPKKALTGIDEISLTIHKNKKTILLNKLKWILRYNQ